MLARDAFGILVDNLSDQGAQAIHRSLAAQGVDTEIVPQEHLPVLPSQKALRRAECLPQCMVIYDALNRPSSLPWANVALIAAGTVTRDQVKRVRTEDVVHGMHGRRVIPVVRDKEFEASGLWLEIISVDGPVRYQVDAGRFQFAYLGDRMQRNAARNFVLLVRDLMAMAPDACANRGAVLMQRDPPESLHYPSPHAFEEEMVWIMMQAIRARDTETASP